MIAVGQDEIVILLEFIDNEKTVPKDVFLHLNHIYNDAVKGIHMLIYFLIILLYCIRLFSNNVLLCQVRVSQN